MFLSDHSVLISKNSSSSPRWLMMSLRIPFTQQSRTNMLTRDVPSNTADAITHSRTYTHTPLLGRQPSMPVGQTGGAPQERRKLAATFSCWSAVGWRRLLSPSQTWSQTWQEGGESRSRRRLQLFLFCFVSPHPWIRISFPHPERFTSQSGKRKKVPLSKLFPPPSFLPSFLPLPVSTDYYYAKNPAGCPSSSSCLPGGGESGEACFSVMLVQRVGLDLKTSAEVHLWSAELRTHEAFCTHNLVRDGIFLFFFLT